MSTITTHVLDAVRGKPAEGVQVFLEQKRDTGWVAIGEGATDKDGRCRDLCATASRATYRLTFPTNHYFEEQGRSSIYPEVVIVFAVDGDSHYHIPLLLSDNSYTTYRGS